MNYDWTRSHRQALIEALTEWYIEEAEQKGIFPQDVRQKRPRRADQKTIDYTAARTPQASGSPGSTPALPRVADELLSPAGCDAASPSAGGTLAGPLFSRMACAAFSRYP